MTCPQCKQQIDAIDAKSYWVGWCQKEIHVDCYFLHARACGKCFSPNAGWLWAQEERPA